MKRISPEEIEDAWDEAHSKAAVKGNVMIKAAKEAVAQAQLEADQGVLDKLGEKLITTNVYYLKEIKSAKESCEKEHQEKVEEIFETGDKIMELVSHADFSDGVEFYGIDEGRTRAYEIIKQLEEDWQALKQECLKEVKE